MNEQPKMGINRTGIQMSPFDTAAMKKDVENLTPYDGGDMSEMVSMRESYIHESYPIGSVPPPATMKGAIKTGASMVMGDHPQLLLDKLSERLAFERTGTRLYEALITKVTAEMGDGVDSVSLEKLMEIRDEEARHMRLVANAIETLGGDPTCQTPSADLAGVESMGLMQVITDPRSSVTDSLHAILIAELADNSGWEMLINIARAQKHDAMAEDFMLALENESEHLRQVKHWLEEGMMLVDYGRRSDQPMSHH